MTLAQMREDVAQGALLRQQHGGDDDIHLLHGLDVLGPEQVHMLGDGLHPDTAGYAHLASSIDPAVRRLLAAAGWLDE